MKEIKVRKEQPSKAEIEGAIELQSPIANQSYDHGQSEVKAKSLERVSTFRQLAKASRSARIAFGSATQFVKPVDLFSPGYRDGYESVPFFVTHTWKFQSKQGYGERLGMEIALSNGRMYNVALGLNAGDLKRHEMLALFSRPGAEPIGPLCLRMLPRSKGNDYYDIVPYESEVSIQGVEIEIPFTAIDEDIPF